MSTTQMQRDSVFGSENKIDVDIQQLFKDCFEDIEMLQQLILLFKGNVFEFIGNVKIHLQSGTLNDVALSAHKLKAGFAMLKANDLRELLIQIELQSKADHSNEVERLYTTFLNEYPFLEKRIDEEVEYLKMINR
ncbi:MAG: Hpt domain-containing protein [Maribacter sp.]